MRLIIRDQKSLVNLRIRELYRVLKGLINTGEKQFLDLRIIIIKRKVYVKLVYIN